MKLDFKKKSLTHIAQHLGTNELVQSFRYDKPKQHTVTIVTRTGRTQVVQARNMEKLYDDVVKFSGSLERKP